MKTTILVILCLMYSVMVNSENINYGLTFHSVDVNKDLRTGLDLTPGKPLNFSDGFSLEFDLKFHSEIYSYGYVFRIISHDSHTLDLITNTGLETLNFVLNGKDKIYSSAEFNKEELVKNDVWLKIKVIIDNNNIICSVNNKSKEMPHSFNNTKDIKFFFGKNGHPVFYTSDVPFMTIKNLEIADKNGKTLREWSLFEHGENQVFDKIKGAKATVYNGKWEIDDYTRWKKIETIATEDRNAQITYDPKYNRLFIATNDSVITYNFDSNNIQGIPVEKGNIFRSGGSQLIYDGRSNRLFSYSIVFDDFITFDFDKREWSSNNTDEGFPQIQQHNRLIDTLSNQLILFGGYGFHKYHAELFKHSLDGGKWEVKDLSPHITPRYLSSMGYLEPNKIMVLGGYGNVSGKQEGLSINLYDLWEIDFETYDCKKLAEFIPPKEQPFVHSNSMVIDKNIKTVYSLTYNNDRFNSSIQLISFDWATSQSKVLADSIPYNFLDIESFCDLILDEKAMKLYAVILQGEESHKYNIEIYSLNYHPMNKDDIFQNETPSLFSANISWKIVVLIFIVLCIFVSIRLIYRKKKNHIRTTISAPPAPKKKISTINLLGGFQVYDKEGVDITEDITSVLKNLFLYILLYSITDGKKITSEKINNTFWNGMDKTSASNNRSVNIKKLRNQLQKVGNIEIVNKNSYWYVSMSEDFNCDYFQVISLLKKARADEIFDKDLIESIVDIASSGVLLPNINADWLDNFKNDFSNTIIDTFTKMMEKPEVKSDLKLMLRISNLILLHDDMDEFAIKNKCFVLYKLGQKGTSKQCYEQFYNEHIKTLNAKPDFTYEDIFIMS